MGLRMPRFEVVGFTTAILFLAGCASVGPSYSAEDLARQEQVRASLESQVAIANEYGFETRDIQKSCAIPFDCTANNNFLAFMVKSGSELNHEATCRDLSELAIEVGATGWRGENMPEYAAVEDAEPMVAECVLAFEAVSVSDDPNSPNGSGAFSFVGQDDSQERPVFFFFNAQSYLNSDGSGGYWLSLESHDNQG